MADRVKYLLLGLLFLVVAGVIAYDHWNSEAPSLPDARNQASIRVDPPAPPARTPAREPALPAAISGGGDAPVAESDERDSGPHQGSPRPPPNVANEPRTPPAAPPSKLPGVEPAREAPPVPPAPKRSAIVHTVAPGETLEGIAMRYFKTRRAIAWIVEANQLRDPNELRVNQRLQIPEPPAGTLEAPAPKRDGVKPARIPDLYLVRAGDGDLYEICRKIYGTRKGEAARVAEIMRLNNLWDAEVKPGMRIRLVPEKR